MRHGYVGTDRSQAILLVFQKYLQTDEIKFAVHLLMKHSQEGDVVCNNSSSKALMNVAIDLRSRGSLLLWNTTNVGIKSFIRAALSCSQKHIVHFVLPNGTEMST